MPSWSCGARNCRSHSQPNDTCGSGTWVCNRLEPPCVGHSSPSDQCSSGRRWTCHASNCPGHSQASHRCGPSRNPRWYCNLERPPCPSHGSHTHRCAADAAAAREQATAASGNRRAAAATTTCPLRDQVRLVRIAEVITPGGAQQVRDPVQRNQYINLPANNSHPEFGRIIKLRAKVEWRSGNRARSLAGKRVYWYIRPQSGNRAPADLVATMRAGLERSGVTQRETRTNADGWTPVVELHLSKYGGDQFDVFATLQSTYRGGRRAGRYTVWRKLYYELDCMRRPGGSGTYSNLADTSGMESKFSALFVELEQNGRDNSPNHRRLLTRTQANSFASNIRQGSGSPRYFHLILLDSIARTVTTQTEEFSMPAGTHQFDMPASSYLLNSSNWFVSATWRQAGSTSTTSINRSKFRLTETGSPANGDDKFVVHVDFTGVVLSSTLDVIINLEFKNWTELSGLQIGSGPTTFVGLRWRERHFASSSINLARSTLNTIVHEPGHATGLAATTQPDGSACSSTYLQNGYHCNHNSNRCVMYHENSTHTNLCSRCGVALRGRDLSRLPVRGNASFS